MSTVVDELVLAGGEVEIQAAGEKAASVHIVAYTGGVMTVPGWGPVALNLAGIDISAPQVSILADHDATLRGIVGHGQAAVAGGKLLVQGTIAHTTEAARHIVELARGGFRFPGLGRRLAQRVRPRARGRYGRGQRPRRQGAGQRVHVGAGQRVA